MLIIRRLWLIPLWVVFWLLIPVESLMAFDLTGRRHLAEPPLLLLLITALAVSIWILKSQLSRKVRHLEKTRQAHRKSEALADAIFDQTAVFLGLLDTSGRIVKVNRTALNVFNTTMDALEGAYFWEGPWWSDRESAEITLREAIEKVMGGAIYRRELSHVDGNGDERIVDFVISPYRDDKGEIIYLIPEGHDITTTRTAEKAVAESEQRFKSIFENAPYAIAIIRFSDGKFLDVNNAFINQWGKPKEKILELFSSDISGVSQEKSRSIRQHIYDSGGIYNVESQVVMESGLLSYLFYSAAPILYGGEECIISFTLDVTDKKKAELALQASEEKYREIFNNAPICIFRTTWDGRFVEANPTMARMLGYQSREELLSSVSDLARDIYPRPAERERLLNALLQKPQAVSLEIELKRKDGIPFYGKMKASLQMDESGKPAFLNGTIEDITETKKMQEIMVQTEKMLSLGGIAAGIAHEINNPLGIILQASQNLTQRTRPDFNKNQSVARDIGIEMSQIEAYMKARKLDIFLQDIRSAAIRASVIIRHMLDFTRRTGSKRTMCNVQLIVEKALALAQNDYDLKKCYDFKKIQIQVEIDAKLPVISCTETEIEQVLLNLFRNSAQAMAEADPPVDAPRITVRVSGSAGGIKIEIEDNGPGIPLNLQRRIFEPFFTTKSPGIGTGLGLSVSYFIITKGHDGRFSVSSEPGSGTCFLIELPIDNSLEVIDEQNSP